MAKVKKRESRVDETQGRFIPGQLDMQGGVQLPLSTRLNFGTGLREGGINNLAFNAALERAGLSAGVRGNTADPQGTGFNVGYRNPNFNAGVQGQFMNPNRARFNLGANIGKLNIGAQGNISDPSAANLRFGYRPNRDTDIGYAVNPGRGRPNLTVKRRF